MSPAADPGTGADRRFRRPAPVSALPSDVPLGWRTGAAIYAALVVGVGLATWPLVRRLASGWAWHHDPYLFTWVMASLVEQLTTDPVALFQGRAIYPYGSTLAFSDPLLAPALVGAPGFLLGQPVLTYNLLLIFLWALDGLAAAWVAHRLTASRAAAWLAGVAFCLCPYFTEFHLEFQMLLGAPVPLALLGAVRWLETRSGRWLALSAVALGLLGYTSWYYAVITGLALLVLGVGCLALRWRAWPGGRQLTALAGTLLLLAGALALPAWPYWVIHRELGWERSLADIRDRHPDLATFVVPASRHPFLRSDRLSHLGETSAYAGFAVLGLAAVSLGWTRDDRARWRPARWLARIAGLVLWGSLAGAVAAAALRLLHVHLGWWTQVRRPGSFLTAALLAGLTVLLARGAEAWRSGLGGRLLPGDWVRLLALTAGVFAVLVLGPSIHVAQREVGVGPYRDLYHAIPALHALRTTVRFAIVYQLCLALLAALGLARLEARLAGRPGARRALLAALGLVLAVEYAVLPIWVEAVPWPRPVDVALRDEPSPAAVLEWPVDLDAQDTRAMLYALAHGKAVVNGHSGFVPPIVQEMGRRLPSPSSLLFDHQTYDALRRIYPLRYLVVWPGLHPADPAWARLRAGTEHLRYRGAFGPHDLYELLPRPQHGRRAERWVSHDFLRHRPALSIEVRPELADPAVEQWVEVTLNDRPVGRLPLEDGERKGLILPRPYRAAAPNVVTLAHRYRVRSEGLDARYEIGRTGIRAPGDLVARSAGGPGTPGGVVELNGRRLAPETRGYNLVALDAAGTVIAAAAFDTFGVPGASGELARWVAALPAGAIVAGAVRDEASRHLGQEAVQALAGLGVSGDLRGRFREAHAFVTVKGTAPGLAAEAAGGHEAGVTVGRPDRVGGFVIEDFQLAAP